MRNAALIILALLAIGTAVLNAYLTPNDLRSCQSEPTTQVDCQPADAIVAISGGNTSVRAAEAISLYKNGWANTIIFSGAAADTSGPSNAEVMRRQAIKAGVPSKSIKVESSSHTTKENAEHTKQVLTEVSGGGAKRVILVTSPYHQRRASLEFKQLTGEGIAIINRPASNDPDWPPVWWLTPRGWWLAGGELVKIIAFYAGESR